MFYIRIDMVNKRQYEISDVYQELKILIPRSSEELKKDFEYLELDYENLSIQDTHIKECEVIYIGDPIFSAKLSKAINNLIIRASESGYTTPFEDMQQFYEAIKNFNSINRDKLLAILVARKEQINNLRDAIKFANNIKKFEILPDVRNYNEMGRYLVNETGHFDEVSLLSEYIDYDKLAIDYTKKGYTYNGTFTDYGYLIEKEDLEASNKEEKNEEEEIE